ncbi:hypothetical protein AB7Y49_16640 [Providencia vermicola]|uniref:Uncharacterized protein n=1 Tax=Providencia vermicola TaxID=333965 RepID=A0AAX3RYG2_9GAMM|nr:MULTISPECIES: hypothetical protein [Providencia]ELX8380275.1 hypothetical protein [Providencia stuartii]EMD5259812.1 hypothetical protein [Providencia stuartii]USB37586.1 hypothetical protein M5J11_03485 [Providencia vermicola]WFC06518.1 hypothetical protein PG365_17840 [Providencia vermicola]
MATQNRLLISIKAPKINFKTRKLYPTIQWATLQHSQLAVHDFMDSATRALIKRFNREVGAGYHSLKDSQHRLAEISEQYLSSRIDMLTAYQQDLKFVTAKYKGLNSFLLSEKISLFHKGEDAVSSLTGMTEMHDRIGSSLTFCLGKTVICTTVSG